MTLFRADVVNGLYTLIVMLAVASLHYWAVGFSIERLDRAHRARDGESRGQVLVEFALVVPVLCLVALGSADLFRLYEARAATREVAEAVTRAVVAGRPADAVVASAAGAAGLEISAWSVTESAVTISSSWKALFTAGIIADQVVTVAVPL